MIDRKRSKPRYFDVFSKRGYNGIISESKMKEMLQNRNFISTGKEKSSDNCVNFTICSYNILAQYQLNNNIYLYTHCDTGVLEWSMRWNNIRNDLQRMDCDVYCLQEVQCDHYRYDIEPAMTQMGYKGFLSSKTGKKLDGCAMFVKTSTFDCEQSSFETVTFHHNDINVLSTDNVGQIALLTPIGRPNSKVCVSNTHLFFNPNRGEIKLAEVSLMLSKIDLFSNSKRTIDRHSDSFYWPIIFCGDLNSEPVSVIYKFLTTGRCDINNVVASDISAQNKTSFWGAKSEALLSSADLPPRIGISDDMVIEESSSSSSSGERVRQGAHIGTGLLSHLLKLKSVYKYSTKDKPRLVTAFTNADTCAVDFIFYRFAEQKVAPHLELVSYLELLTSDEFFSFGGIPNRQHGSDHIPIVANFNLHV